MDACPDGWHLPSQDEWNILAETLGGTSVAGGMLKEAGLDHWVTPNAGATNESGFTALPGGYRHSSGSFGFKGTHGDFWTATEVNDVSARWKGMLYDQQNLSKGSISKQNGFSVRCVKGEGYSLPTVPTVTTTSLTNITYTKAEGGGTVTEDGGKSIIARGDVRFDLECAGTDIPLC